MRLYRLLLLQKEAIMYQVCFEHNPYLWNTTKSKKNSANKQIMLQNTLQI